MASKKDDKNKSGFKNQGSVATGRPQGFRSGNVPAEKQGALGVAAGSAPLMPLTREEFGVSTAGSASDLYRELSAEEEYALTSAAASFPYRQHSGRAAKVDGRVNPNYTGQGLVNRFGDIVTSPLGQMYYVPDDAETMWSAKSPANKDLLAQWLVTSGYLDAKQAGNANSVIGSLQDAMNDANRWGFEVENYLSKASAGDLPSRPRSSSSGQIRTYRTTNSLDIINSANTVAQNTIGMRLSDAEAAQFAQQYQAQEVSFQKSLYGGGQVTDPPSLESAALSFIQQTRPQQEAGYKYLGYMNQLFDSIGAF